MGKKGLIIIFSLIFLLTLNFCAAQDVNNSTEEILTISDESMEVYAIDNVENQSLKVSSSLESTHIDVVSNTSFDAIGEYFKVKLLDNDNKSISNTNLEISVNGKTYNSITNKNGIASLQIRLNDGSYNITSKFTGDKTYKSSSKTTTITVNNTRVVSAGLSNSEIQNIIDNAKANNVILFEGTTYNDINLKINKRLTLISKVDTLLKSGSTNPVISISGDKSSLTTIKGFNIRGNGNGVEISNANYVTVIGNDITTNGNAIVAENAKYLNITKNNLVKNSKSAIVLANVENSHIYKNKINNNGADGIQLAKTNKVYIYDNTISGNSGTGIYTSTSVNGKNYGESPKNLHITNNNINSNREGIYIKNAGDNIRIGNNVVNSNKLTGISISNIGSNTIQSNVITNNGDGIRFNDEYKQPKNQEISYNAIFDNIEKDVEAKDTYYQENGQRLEIGDNWYTDYGYVCPKIKTNGIKFSVKQVGKNQFQATFTDSYGNIASLLPDRTLTYSIGNGKTVSLTVSGGIATFNVDAENGDLVKAAVDSSKRNNEYDAQIKNTVTPINGVTPSYSYPDIQYQSDEDIGNGGNGNGNGNGEGTGGSNNKGNGNSNVESSDFTGNGTTSRNLDPANTQANQVNDVSQSVETTSTTSQASASEAGSNTDVGESSADQSVVKQIIIDEEDVVKITGISIIVLLIILTIGFYYREDIREMKSKM